jgi:hypothetical protein
MSKTRLAGLVGALAASAGGFGAWASPPPEKPAALAPDPAAGARDQNRGDLDLTTLRMAEARPSDGGLVAPAHALADTSDASRAEAILGARNGQSIGRPSPTSWFLLVIGVGMIGGALRGFIVANRALARLQPDDLD